MEEATKRGHKKARTIGFLYARSFFHARFHAASNDRSVPWWMRSPEHGRPKWKGKIMQVNVITTGFSIGSRMAPGLTAAAAERLFFTTRRSAPRPGELAILRSARPSRLSGMQAWSWGRGPTVLLVHGWNGRATQLGGFVEPLLRSGYRVVAFDAFGHGQSPGRRLSLPELAVCIRQIADELGEVYGIIAHSLGGAATTLALSEGLEIERAVLVSPPADPRRFLQTFGAVLGITEGVRERLQRRIEHRLAMPMTDMQTDVIARSMRTPVLVIHDQDDKEVPVEAGQRIAKAWPNAELLITQGLGHQRILRSESIARVAVRFIDAAARRKCAA
jgi:pimeloyl-ACP methyl ester carboxylesterase